MIPNLEFYYKTTSEELEVILCGTSHGMDSDFIKSLYEGGKKAGRSVAIFNYLFQDRFEKKGMGDNLSEEVETLSAVLDFCKSSSYKKIRLVGKSIGGVIAGKFLSNLSHNEQKKFELWVLGYDLGWIKIGNFIGKITIIQGEKDPFGDIELVKKDMDGAASTDIVYYEIGGADHSYKEPETGYPKFQQEVVDLVSKE